jgi:hypothetical protein
MISSYEVEYGAGKKEIPAKVFIACGDLENDGKRAQGLSMIVEKVKGKKYVGLTLSNMVLKNETHMSGWPAVYSQGLRELFKD